MTEALPEEFWLGIEQFNQREFYACHDTLEAIWMEAGEPERTLYQGILQIAVAFYHLSNQNGRGAMILLGEGINRLRKYTPDYEGVEISPLLSQCQRILQTVQTTEADGLAALWASLLHPPSPDSQSLPTIVFDRSF
jgi:predicted metal-dependent hydrolase